MTLKLNIKELKDGHIIPAHKFYNLLKVKEIIVPDVVDEIEKMAFTNCIELTRVEGLQNVKKIGNRAFFGCLKLPEINLPNVREIENVAFCSCVSLKTVSCPKLEKVGHYSFGYCFSLQNLNAPNIKHFGKSVFFENDVHPNGRDKLEDRKNYEDIVELINVDLKNNYEDMLECCDVDKLRNSESLNKSDTQRVLTESDTQRVLTESDTQSMLTKLDLRSLLTKPETQSMTSESDLQSILTEKYNNTINRLYENLMQKYGLHYERVIKQLFNELSKKYDNILEQLRKDLITKQGNRYDRIKVLNDTILRNYISSIYPNIDIHELFDSKNEDKFNEDFTGW